MKQSNGSRRTFLQRLAMAGIASQTLLRTGSVKAAAAQAQGQVEGGLGWPDMAYQTLGRTGFEGSRLVFGCGASLSRRPRDRLLGTALKAGVNVFDVGTGRYYGDAERNMANFLAKARDDVFLISKSIVYLDDEVGPGDSVTPTQAKQGAKAWLEVLEESLRDLRVEMIDAYYQMAANNTDLVGSEEMRRAFEQARDAGKIRFWGLSDAPERPSGAGEGHRDRLVRLGHDRRNASRLVRLGRQKHPARLAADDRFGAALGAGAGGRHRTDRHEGRPPPRRAQLPGLGG